MYIRKRGREIDLTGELNSEAKTTGAGFQEESSRVGSSVGVMDKCYESDTFEFLFGRLKSSTLQYRAMVFEYIEPFSNLHRERGSWGCGGPVERSLLKTKTLIKQPTPLEENWESNTQCTPHMKMGVP